VFIHGAVLGDGVDLTSHPLQPWAPATCFVPAVLLASPLAGLSQLPNPVQSEPSKKVGIFRRVSEVSQVVQGEGGGCATENKIFYV